MLRVAFVLRSIEAQPLTMVLLPGVSWDAPGSHQSKQEQEAQAGIAQTKPITFAARVVVVVGGGGYMNSIYLIIFFEVIELIEFI